MPEVEGTRHRRRTAGHFTRRHERIDQGVVTLTVNLYTVRRTPRGALRHDHFTNALPGQLRRRWD